MLNLQQQLKLRQKLSPQQIQYIKLLQLNHLALEQRIITELQENPALEEEMLEVMAEEEVPDSDTDEFDWEELLPSGTDDFDGYRTQTHQDQPADRPLPAQPSLISELRSQISFLSLNAQQQLIAEQIIGSIDDDGYMDRELLSIVDVMLFTHGQSVTTDEVEEVLQQIQRLDPAGIAARDLQECLAVQAEMLPPSTPGRHAAVSILSKCYDDFIAKRYPRILQKLKLTEETLKEAVDLIQSLNPKPGEGTISQQQNQITPDFEVRIVSDELQISATRPGGPRVRISRHYTDMLKQLTPKSGPVKRHGPDAETRQFLKKRLESASWFLDAIEQRRQTILAVMQAIVAKQEEFFRKGPGHLKPLILVDIAEMIDMDISTVSRGVSGKYVQCDFGIFELKYFFSEGVPTHSGEMVSNTEVKAIMEDIIRQEDKTSPLSDRELAEALDALNFSIARRTVTKYREQLGIPIARMRKEIVLAS